MGVSGHHVPAGHHRGDDGDAHGGVGRERAADGGAGSTGRRAAGGPPAATLADRESALTPSRGAARSPPPEPRGEPRRAGDMSSQRLLSSHQSNQLVGLSTICCP
jgi:hypothetical protein